VKEDDPASDGESPCRLQAMLMTILSVKREISHLCRDTTPPPGPHRRRSEPSTASPVQSDLPVQPKTPAQLPSSLYSDPNFPPAWPLLPDTAGPVTYGDGIGGESEAIKDGGMGNGAWGANDESELGALTCFTFSLPAEHVS